MAKVKIVLDADVILHFSKVDRLVFLTEIFPEYDYVVLSKVYDEIKEKKIKDYLDRCVLLLKTITIVQFNPTGEMYREYAILSSKRGVGESACMAYCKYTNNVIGSSNLKDIENYCKDNEITYLTTIDFLYYAVKKRKMTKLEAENFILEVRDKGSILPENINFATYIPSSQM